MKQLKAATFLLPQSMRAKHEEGPRNPTCTSLVEVIHYYYLTALHMMCTKGNVCAVHAWCMLTAAGEICISALAMDEGHDDDKVTASQSAMG